MAKPAKIDRLLVFNRPVIPNDTFPELTPMLSAKSEKDSRELSGILASDDEAADSINEPGDTAPESVKQMFLSSSLKVNVPVATQ